MRLLPLLMTLMFVVSCGKDNSNPSSTGSGNRAHENVPGDIVEREEEMMITSDGSSVDLLDSIIDVPVEISPTTITFKVAKMSVADGDKISCKTQVGSGEAYQYSVTGKTLQLQTAAGNYSMSRLNDDGSGLIGTWTWKGKGPNGMDMLKTMSVVSNSRVILKNHCEL